MRRLLLCRLQFEAAQPRGGTAPCPADVPSMLKRNLGTSSAPLVGGRVGAAGVREARAADGCVGGATGQVSEALAQVVRALRGLGIAGPSGTRRQGYPRRVLGDCPKQASSEAEPHPRPSDSCPEAPKVNRSLGA